MDQPASAEELEKRAALRREQLAKFRRQASQGSDVSFPPPPLDLCPPTFPSNPSKENINHVSATGNDKVDAKIPESEPGSLNIKKVFASLSDAYRSVDEEDTHSLSSSKPRTPQKDNRPSSSGTSRSSDSPGRKAANSSPRKISTASIPSKITRPTGSPARNISKSNVHDSAELSVHEKKAMFEKPVRYAPPPPPPESCTVQEKKAMFEKSTASAASASAASASSDCTNVPSKAAVTDPQTLRRALFQEAATKAQDPSQRKPEAVKSERRDAEPKSPKKNPVIHDLSAKPQSKLSPFIEPPKEVGTFTKTLQDKLLDQKEAWRLNPLAVQIENQKQEDMNVLKKRWELMAEEEKLANQRHTLIEQALEKRKANGTPPMLDRPPPLPLPGSSALHETVSKSTAEALEQSALKHHPMFVMAVSALPTPPAPANRGFDHSNGRDEKHRTPLPSQPPARLDAIARFENRGGSGAGTGAPPPPPPLPPPYMGKIVPFTYKPETRKRQKLPEEEGLTYGESTEGSYEEREENMDVAESQQLGWSASREHSSTLRYKRSADSRNHSKGAHYGRRDDDYLSDGSNETDESPQKRSSSSKVRSGLNNSYVYEQETASDTTSEIESIDTSTSNTQPISLSFYRKTQKETGSGIKKILVQDDRRSIAPSEDEDTQRTHAIALHQQKIDALYGVSAQQQAILVQTTSALNLCRSAPEFQGSTERAECERLLLVSAKKRDACHAEMNRLKALVSQLKQGNSLPSPGCYGKVTISEVVLPTKDGFVDHIHSESELMHYFVILLKHRESVQATQMVNSVQHLQSNGKFTFPSTITFENLENDFVISVEVYAVQTRRDTLSHDERYHIKDKTKKKEKGFTLKSFIPGLKDGGSKHSTPSSPSKQEVRQTSFGCIGFCNLSLQNIHNGTIHLSKVPDHAAPEGTLSMKTQCGVALESSEEGFLTMFEDSCGPSGWHRRWCVLKNDSILMWKYPEDMQNTNPQVCNLRWVTGQAECLSLNVCARPNTFQMTLNRPLRLAGDVREAGPYKYLFSADGKEERFIWYEKINKVLSAVRDWIPTEKTFKPR